MGDQGKYEPVLEMDEKKPQTSSSEQEEAASSHIDIHDNLEEPFDEDFWEKVEQKFAKDIAWNRAMDEVRVARWEKRYKERTLEVMIRHWPDTDKYKNRPELIASLEHQINRFTEILLEQDNTSKRKRKYRNFRVDEDDDPACPTLLHLAAERNFVHVAKSLVDKDGGALYLRTEKHGSERRYLPVEIALMKFHDETAAYLITKMKHEWIHRLFLCRGSQLKADFRFKTYILHPNMKKTVVAVLDCLINPQWPYLPAKKERYSSKAEERGIERAWSSVPDDPLNYHFLYHLLEADENGQPPKLKGSKNTLFNQSSKSALHCIAESNNKGAIQHPVVRMLVSRKWSNYAHFLFSLQALCYVFFLLVLSYALIYGSTRSNPNAYISHGDRLRALCEVISIIFIMFYIVAEANQMEKERVRYFKDFYNALDWLGLLLTLIVLPLRFSSVKEQWILASLGFLFNFMRLFKFSCVSRTTGLYTKTLAKIIYQDLTRFLVVFAVVFIAFCGALFLSLKATDSQELFSGFELILLAGIRALVEQQPFNDSYNKYRWLTTILVLIYMAMVVVILLNILIAQLSTTYEDARKIARLQYDVDRMRIISRLESSRFESFSLRVKYYEDGGWISEEKLAHELLEYDDESHPWESIEKKLSKIRDTMRKVMRGLPTLDDSY